MEGVITFILLFFANFVHRIYSAEQCPGFEVPNIRNQVELNEISVILYYTQWSDESLEALREFNDVAEYFEYKIYFAAINCWHLACNCSKTLSTIGNGLPHKWPTLIVHYNILSHLKIQYNGLFKFREIINFVLNVMQPLERVYDIVELGKLKSLADGIVLGVFQKSTSYEYNHYLKAALKWLEHDPIRTYRFAITFSDKIKGFNETNIKGPDLLLLGHKTNKTFSGYSDFKWNTSNILHWLHKEFNDEYSILHGYNTPITIAQKIKTQPVLAIFVHEPHQFYSYMEKHVDYQKPFTRAALACEDIKRKNSITNWKKTLRISKYMRNLLVFMDSIKCYYHRDVLLKNLNFYYEINQYIELFKNDKYSSDYEKPKFEVHELLSFFQSTICLQQKDIASQIALHTSILKMFEGHLANEQQSKSSNRSLGVVLLDMERYKDFLENIDVSPSRQSMATVFIIDNEKENMFVMEENFSMINVMEFVNKFYTRRLNNCYRNKEIKLSSPRYYDIELKQLSRDLFLNNLQYTHNQTLVVLIHSTNCALCANIQYSFIQLSLLLRDIGDIKFIRINSMHNDLPWQFNMPALPALLVFPENRFSESRLFPAHLKPDIQNVFGFILSQLSAHKQVKIVLDVCKSGALPKNHTQSCWQFAKTVLMQHIGKHLQYWQMFEAERSSIFDHLRAFKDMSLDIQSNLRL